jgi:hypothetical protein
MAPKWIPEIGPPKNYSVTLLGGCLRQKYYDAMLPYRQYPSKGWAAYRGTLAHSLLERAADPGAIVERKLVKSLDGVPLVGKPDEIRPLQKLIVDYKTKEKLPRGLGDLGMDKYISQLNAYRWLCAGGSDYKTGEVVDYEIDELRLAFLTMMQFRQFVVPVRSFDQVEDELMRAIMYLQVAFEGGPPPPRGEDPRKSKLCSSWCAHGTGICLE